MIVKIIKEFALNGRTYCIGETVDTTPDNAVKWVQSNLAECKDLIPVPDGGLIPRSAMNLAVVNGGEPIIPLSETYHDSKDIIIHVEDNAVKDNELKKIIRKNMKKQKS